MGDRLHRPQPAEVGWEESVCGEAEDPTSKCVGSLKVPPALISMYWTLVRPHTNHKVDGLLVLTEPPHRAAPHADHLPQGGSIPMSQGGSIPMSVKGRSHVARRQRHYRVSH